MPNLQSAKKEMRASAAKRLVNDRRRRTMRRTVKDIRADISSGKEKEAISLLPNTYQAIDKAAKRGVIKKNTANRLKSRISISLSKITKK